MDSSRKPEQAARADIDDLGVIRQDAISRLFRYFHELIHIVQWRLLGPERFLADYADGLARFGYRDSPLEVMAYDAQARFGRDPEPFDAELFVSQSLGSQ